MKDERSISKQLLEEMKGIHIGKKLDLYDKIYFSRDINILIDYSMTFLTALPFICYNNIFFGNKIKFTKECVEKMKRKVQTGEYCTETKNCIIMLQEIKNDEYNNYEIIDIKSIKILEFVSRQKSKMILYTSSKSMYDEAKKIYLRVRLYNKGYVEYDIETFSKMYDTVGSIQLEESGMFIIPNDIKSKKTTVKKVFNKHLECKNGDKIKLNQGDVIFIKKETEEIYTILVYVVVNMHSRHSTVKLLWTDIKKGEEIKVRIPDILENLIKNEIYNI